MNHSLRRILLATVFCCLLINPAFAWNFVGHEVIARIAWDRITPEARESIVAILRQHPALEHDLLKGMPADFGDADLFAFMVAATWPDIIRDKANPWNATHHHSVWHYINIPIIPEGTDVTLLRGAVTGPMEWVEGTDPANVVQALQKCVTDLADPNLPGPEKAIALSWYLHLAGDLHQPLHAGTLFDARFPEGDRGGNGSMVRSPILTTQPSLVSKENLLESVRPRMTGAAPAPATLPVTALSEALSAPTTIPSTSPETPSPATFPAEGPINLHAYWDNIFGRFGSPRVLDALAREITTEHPSTSLKEQSANLDFAAWARESHHLAVHQAYREGTLVTRTQDELSINPTIELPALPDDYLDQARVTARERMAVAGNRMARQLNEIFNAAP